MVLAVAVATAATALRVASRVIEATAAVGEAMLVGSYHEAVKETAAPTAALSRGVAVADLILNHPLIMVKEMTTPMIAACRGIKMANPVL